MDQSYRILSLLQNQLEGLSIIVLAIVLSLLTVRTHIPRILSVISDIGWLLLQRKLLLSAKQLLDLCA